MDMQLQQSGQHRQRLQSDSSDSSNEQTLDQYIQASLHKIANDKKSKSIKKRVIGYAVIFICCIIAILLYTIHIFGVYEQFGKSYQQYIKEQGKIQAQNDQNFTQSQNEKQSKMIVEQQRQGQEIFTLHNFNMTIQTQNAYFFDNKIKNGTNHWFYKNHQFECIPDQVINSATKISYNLYAQMTAYQDISVLKQRVIIPDQNIYALESPRQFLRNYSVTYPQKITAFDHHNSLLLVLSTKYFSQGIFVSDNNNWRLQEKNLIFNDLYLLAIKKNHYQLINSHSYDTLITNNLTLALDLLVFKKRQLTILIDFTYPVLIKTAQLLKIKVYSLSEGFQCNTTSISVYEEVMWYIDEEAYLVPGWYVFTYPDNDISFGTQHLNYNYILRSENKKECIPESQFIQKQTYFKSNKIFINSLAYRQMYLINIKKKIDQKQYRQISGYFSNLTAGYIYLSDGPLEYLLIAAMILSPKTIVLINSKYKQKKLFFKNLVLNSQEGAQQVDQDSILLNGLKFLVTASHSTIQRIEAEKYIFLNQNIQQVNPHYQYTQLVQNGCFQPKKRRIVNHYIEKGVFQVQKIA